MRLLLIRHGETVDNVAGRCAGITDSALTSHGVLQASRLGAYLAATEVKVAHIFSSDLRRAVNTADAILRAQPSSPSTPREVVKLSLLREKDFGSHEGKAAYERGRSTNRRSEVSVATHTDDPSFKEMESEESMRGRMDTFVDRHLSYLVGAVLEEHSVIVVAHGVILRYLWGAIMSRVLRRNIAVAPGAVAPDRPFSLEYPGFLSNTGYFDLMVKPILSDATAPIHMSPGQKRAGETEATDAKVSSLQENETKSVPSPPAVPTAPTRPVIPDSPSPMLPRMSLVVLAVNCQTHLQGLKKTKGGIGSLQHDSTQRTMDSFFKKTG